jgi:hypothetical protein
MSDKSQAVRHGTQDIRYALNNKRNNRGGTILLLTVLILTSVLTITLVSSDIIRNGLLAGRSQVNSTKAYFAAEAGAERILYDIRNNGFDVGGCNFFDYVKFGSPDTCDAIYSGAEQSLSNTSKYYVTVGLASDGITTYATSTGMFSDVSRVIEISF